LWDWHLVRAIFQPAPQVKRPVLIAARFPPTVDIEENASVTVAFDVGPGGVPTRLRAVKSSSARWEDEVLKALHDGWRFRPGNLNDKPVAVPAWLEFVRGSHSPIPPAEIPAR
jgi:hypothetical protein